MTLLSAACASYRPINPTELAGILKAGDKVKVTRRDGQESQFEIAAITPDAIVGEGQQIQLADVKELDRLEAPWLSRAAAVIVGLAGIALLAALAVGLFIMMAGSR